MKRRCWHTNVLAYFLVVCLLTGAFFALAPSNVHAAEPNTPSSRFLQVLGRIEELERATERFYDTENTFDYTTRYIRSGVYSNIHWQLLVGSPDSEYVKAMKDYSDLRKVRNLFVMTDRSGNRYDVDFPHMAAVADAKRDFAGWAGDLITLASDVGSLFEARLMMGSEYGMFGLRDIRADIDALNLYEISRENGGSLSRAMRSYYLDGGVDMAVTTFLLRETGLDREDLSIETVYASFMARLNRDTCEPETLSLEEAYGLVGSERLEYVCQAFAEWLFRTYCDETSGHEDIVRIVYEPTCARDGYTCVICLKCGRIEWDEVVLALPHLFEEECLEPTEDEPGIIRQTCKSCDLCISTCFDTLQKGDVDLDGKLTARDYMRLKRSIFAGGTLTLRQQFLADVDEDGELSALDYILLKHRILASCPKTNR